ncbi:TetR/AcrR family transcriptional regulator [Paracoccus denitrificans]|jgi:TetR/AcrR family transcriptional repressor of mexJK operon|nr:TetR/AcrR family transcriptional regulator [Paracoccus denitrificans]MBB4627862.1 TetR/AcrR family transcriptional repressor of mexJK operon [Paracoccus denitrificans]MCU7428603.1 TetR/AcrR family transcriptional regulator [Paracoccus denitrificans]UPV95365.1 TetR/AcrR family transcriptional regulator [Paracoccus denitrificans]WQO32576.1 TetR/AcrR family transcriptional regulator [Paracoccus denitrificans]SDI60110.1 transcriptional regulator, TetR family [Paracoccus denitrificans]
MAAKQESPAGRGRGKPRDAGLRERILKAAEAEFLDEGLEGARMERIAMRAGTSKMALYQHFASKMVLFHQVRNNLLIDHLPHVDQFPLDAEPRQVLAQIAKRYLKAITAAATIQQLHLLCQPRARDVRAATAFFDTGPQAAVRQVDALLQRYCDQGVFAIPAPRMAAEQFLAMVRGNEHMRALLDLPPGRDEQALDIYLASCVDLFMRAFRAE